MPYGVRVEASSSIDQERGRPGPKPRFSRQQLVDVALALTDRDGFDALSLRAVARELGVTPMALYTYVDSSDELAAMVIEQLVELKAPKLRHSRSWQQTLRTFANSLAELVGEHPALLQAYAQGAVRTPAALRVAETVLEQLQDGGLGPRLATEAYAAVHALVLGQSLLQGAVSRRAPGAVVDADEFPIVTTTVRAKRRPGEVPLSQLVNLLISGIEARAQS